LGEAVAWTVLAYLFSGPLVYGGLGLLADHWLGTTPVFVLVGIVGGTGLGLWAGWLRYGALDRRPSRRPRTPVELSKETS
jgi:F0F1-type ATP synthase assembly protein I